MTKSVWIVSRAALTILCATLDSRLAFSTSSRTGATAIASTESKPAAFSFPAVIGPTPLRSEMSVIASCSSVNLESLRANSKIDYYAGDPSVSNRLL